MCPDFVRPDCSRWLSEVDAQMPTIVVAAKDADGNDTTDVAVTVDGNRVADLLDGRPIPMDPGAHNVRFEHAGVAPIERRIVIQQGIKNRPIEVSFQVGGPEPQPPSYPAGPEQVNGPNYTLLVLGSVFAGLSIPAFVSFAVFGLKGKAEADDLNNGCGNTEAGCPAGLVDDAENKLVIADVSLGVGIGMFALGAGFIIAHFATGAGDPEPSAIRWGVAPRVGDNGIDGAAGHVVVPF